MNSFQLATLFAFTFCLSCTGPHQGNHIRTEPTQPLPDGVYLVVEKADNLTDLTAGQGGRVIPHNHRYAANTQRTTFLRIEPQSRVQLNLASGPDVVTGSDGSSRIAMELNRREAGKFERLTENAACQAAVVIAGEAVTVHKIRSPIRDGRLHVSCCAAGACDYLLEQLGRHTSQTR